MTEPKASKDAIARPKVTAEQAQKYFQAYIREHADEIDALGRPS